MNNTAYIDNTTRPLTDDITIALRRGEHPGWLDVLINVIVWFMFIFTVLGNALVIVAFIREPKLRSKVSNLYILNLSLSDFIVGCVSLSLNNIYRKTGLWQFGEVVCKLWLVVDWAACFVSVWAIVLISYDRYVLVTKGLEYDRIQTRRKFCLLSGVSWVGCFLRYGGAFIGYDILNNTSVDYSNSCDHPTLYMLPLILFDWATSICLPVALIAVFNIYVYVNIYKRSRGLSRVTSIQPDSITEHTINNDQLPAACPAKKREGTNDIRKLRRSAITLALIVGVSAMCWSPYYAYIFATVVFHADVEIILVMSSYYIWWGNSACNPLLFVATHPGIRLGVKKILLFRK